MQIQKWNSKDHMHAHYNHEDVDTKEPKNGFTLLTKAQVMIERSGGISMIDLNFISTIAFVKSKTTHLSD